MLPGGLWDKTSPAQQFHRGPHCACSSFADAEPWAKSSPGTEVHVIVGEKSIDGTRLRAVNTSMRLLRT